MFRMRVTPDGGEPYDLVAEARDILAWEKTGRDRSFGEFLQRLRMTEIYALAHVAAKRQGRFDGPLAMFENDVDVLPLPDKDDEDEPDPTPTDR